MRLRSEAKKAAQASTPPLPDPPPSPSRIKAFSNTKAKAAAKVVESPSDAAAEAPVESPAYPPIRQLRPLAMAPPKPLPGPPAIPSFVYQSAYSGSFIANTDECLNNFVCKPDRSHELFGYWRFGSEDDERRAHARGFSKPEDVLVAQDRGDGSYDGIFLRWVCGSEDPNLGTLLFGSAVDHLKTIYEIRHILGQPMSLRGCIPLYPTSDDVRVKNYLVRKFFLEEAAKSNDSASSSEKQVLPVGNSESRLLVPLGIDEDQLAPVRSENRAPGDISKQTQDIGAGPTSSCLNTLQLRAGLPLAPPKAQKSGDATSVTSFESLPSQKAGLNLKPTATYSFSKYSALQPGAAFSPPASPSEVNTRVASQVQAAPLFESSRQDTSSSFHETVSRFRYVSPYSLPQGNTARRSISTVNTPYTPPSDSRPSSPLKSSPLTKHMQSIKPQVGALTESVRGMPKCNPVRPASVQPQLVCDDTAENPRSINDQQHVGTSSIMSQRSKVGPDFQDLPNAQEWEDLEVGQEDIPSDGDTPQYVFDMDNKQVSSSTKPITEVKGWLEDVPCMDCGLDVGHKSDCHIGSLKPMENLTVLDHRSLADAVERFDPGPWTTHFDQYAQQAPEDPAVQIQGMAKVIRNEDSYKSDPELHNLPDDALILMWAFKTSSEVEVVNEWG